MVNRVFEECGHAPSISGHWSLGYRGERGCCCNSNMKAQMAIHYITYAACDTWESFVMLHVESKTRGY